jgi:hypothetical protein
LFDRYQHLSKSGDLTIIQEYEKACARFPMSEVFIWFLDSDLRSYRQNP